MPRVLVVFALLLLLAGGLFTGATAQDAAPQRKAVVAEIAGPIGPATVRYVEKAIQEAQRSGADVLILRLNTPGGLLTSTREIVQAILASPVPVAGYVSPSGAHAASAGTYILYSTHVAAMAPGTNIGAATPIRIGPPPPKPLNTAVDTKPAKPSDKDKSNKEDPGKGLPKTNADALDTKTVNDAVAFIRELAQLRGRNADWAEKAVRNASTLGARQALEEKVIEIIAPDTEDLLAQLNGRTVTVNKETRVLATKGAAVTVYKTDFLTNALGALVNPNVALILLLAGIYLLIFELANPGQVAPGVIGVISIVLALYALQELPLNYAGLTLVLLGLAFMIAEAFVPSYGVLGIGGITAFILGSVMLIDTDVPAFQVSWTVIGAMAIVSAAFLILMIGYLWRLRRRPVQTGAEQMVGSEAVVIDWAGSRGHVWTQGERWEARGEGPFVTGQSLKITRVEHLTVFVAPAEAEPGKS